jgi:hypothetical protein
VPISIGELYDKISILEIKSERIKDENKLANIIKEQFILIDIYNIFKLQHYDMFIKLKDINIKLWDVEDKLRIKEKNKIFDDEFIQLARSVYFLNDKRAEIKKEINVKYESDIIEEKQYINYE